ncbi:MAG: ribosome biogenesis GTPase Der [Alphaproteobacteria bacterium]
MAFTLAILGRPNVGKSTLFNRLCRLRTALVDAAPGVTRDRRYGDARLGDLKFRLIDTAGLEDAAPGTIEASMREQTDQALDEADAALMVIDARAGVTPIDRHFADWLRHAHKPVILVANKCEGARGESGMIEAWELGLGDPVPISAEHNEGMAELHVILAPLVDAANAEVEAPEPVVPDDSEDTEPADKELLLAIVGRPNVGKSTLLNRLVGEARVITGPEPGVTRDAISVAWEWRGRPLRLIDTAGLRRRGRIQEKLEKLSVGDTLRAIRFAHVVVLVVDATAMPERQDLTIASHVIDEGRALVIAVNKWDMVEDRAAAMRKLTDRLEISLPQVRGIPIVTLSALTGEGVDRLMPAVAGAYDIWNKRLTTATLNRWLDDAVERHPPPVVKGRRLRLRYMTQVKGRPPTFVVFSTRPAALPESYRRFLANGLRETFGLDGVPIRVVLRKGENPYAKK